MRYSVLTTIITLTFLVSCSSSEDFLGTQQADWVDEAQAVMGQAVTDPTGDFETGVVGAPPYSQPVSFSPIDVTQVTFGMLGDYLFMQLDFDGTIPQTPQDVSATGEVEAQQVLAQSFKFALDTDNNDGTGGTGEGVDGVDLCFEVRTDYGQGYLITASYDIPTGPMTTGQSQLTGEFGAGGPGSEYMLVRFDLSSVGSDVLPRGGDVEVGGWSVAESDLYDELTHDSLQPRTWSVPMTPGGGVAGQSEEYSIVQSD